MKYCKKCKHIYNDEDYNCDVCKRPTIEIKDENTPVYLLSASGFELSRVQTALEDNGIPCYSAAQKKNISADAVTGNDISEYDLLVPFSAYEKAYDLCVGIGAIEMEGVQIEEDNEYYDDGHEEMSSAKRTTVRVLSAILLIVMFGGVIWGVDALLSILKGLF